jgi:hypothetical protein
MPGRDSGFELIPLGDLPAGPGVYVLHLSEPLAHARGYVGWAADIGRRVAEHLDVEACRQAGFHVASHRGSPLVCAAIRSGRSVIVVQLYPGGDRGLERRLHNRHHPRICPSAAPSARCSRAESAFEGASAALTARQPIVRD